MGCGAIYSSAQNAANPERLAIALHKSFPDRGKNPLFSSLAVIKMSPNLRLFFGSMWAFLASPKPFSSNRKHNSK